MPTAEMSDGCVPMFASLVRSSRDIHSVAINEFPKWKNARFFSHFFVFKTMLNDTYYFKIVILHTNM